MVQQFLPKWFGSAKKVMGAIAAARAAKRINERK